MVAWGVALVMSGAGCGGSGGANQGDDVDGAVGVDGALPDAGSGDAAAPDAAVGDAAAQDAALGDAAPGDAALGDAASGDAAPGDAALPDGALPDAGPTCAAPAPCPGAPPSGYVADDGLLAMDPCAFPLGDDDTWASNAALVDELALALPEVGVDDVLLHLNRTGSAVTAADLTSGSATVPGFSWGFAWSSGDEGVAYWIPQGLTGSPDADPSGLVSGRRLVIVTWYYDAASDPSSPGEKGIRISLADATHPATATYRLLLLVEPYHDGTRANFRAINIHAGGAVWFGHLLYVADTTTGFRVFDLSRILQVNTSQDRIGYDPGSGAYHAFRYRYVVPQVGRYRHQSSCSPRFSFVGLDRSTSPPSLLSGEYSNTGIAGRLYRWPLDPSSGRLGAGVSYPSEAWYLGKRQVQGAVAHGGTVYLSSSEPPSGHGDLTRTQPGARLSTSTWIDGPEDLLYDGPGDELWGCGEGTGRRFVFGVDANALP